MKRKAIVIIPTYNERGNIERTLAQLLHVFDGITDWNMHALVVDDTSPDKTYELVENIAKKDKRVHLVLNKQKSGLGGAYLRGMKEAFGALKADLVFEFDADLSHDPKKIPQFLKKIDEGADLVLGSRYIPGGGIPQNWGIHRKFLSVVGNWVIMLILTNFAVRDWTTGYRAIRKKVYESVAPSLTSERFSGYTFQIGFLYTALQHGFRVAEVPFQFVDREYGKSKLGPEYIKNTMLFILRMRIESLLKHRVFKFVIVGGIGSAVQLLTQIFWRSIIPSFQIANFLSIECAILSNFVLNNSWTFADKKLKPTQYMSKFIQFNIASGGSIVIQVIVALLGETFIGLLPLFKLPVIAFTVDTGHVFAVVGILIGMFWNFFAYNKFIWKK